tara:strand:+ start:165 stop:515 length:351 start_codon:yes stop_codon:yes gene_type:complete
MEIKDIGRTEARALSVELQTEIQNLVAKYNCDASFTKAKIRFEGSCDFTFTVTPLAVQNEKTSDLNFNIGDTFTFKKHSYKITSLDENKKWAVRAEKVGTDRHYKFELDTVQALFK